LKPVFDFQQKRRQQLLNKVRSAVHLSTVMHRWYTTAHQNKYNDFFSKMRSIKLRIVIYMRIFRKRFAARLIIHCMTEAKENEAMRGRVRRVLRSVRLMQRVGKDFIACTRARAKLVSVVLEKLERRYVRDILRLRKESLWKTSTSFLSEIRLDNKTLNEMHKQDKSWNATDAKMESILQVHREHGLLQKLTEEVEVEKHLMPAYVRTDIARNVVKLKRHEHLQIQRAAFKKIVVKKQFDEADALAMLRGDERVLTIAMGLLNPRRVLEVTPFLMFKLLRRSEMTEMIQGEHEDLQTFVVRKQRGSLMGKRTRKEIRDEKPAPLLTKQASVRSPPGASNRKPSTIDHRKPSTFDNRKMSTFEQRKLSVIE